MGGQKRSNKDAPLEVPTGRRTAHSRCKEWPPSWYQAPVPREAPPRRALGSQALPWARAQIALPCGRSSPLRTAVLSRPAAPFSVAGTSVSEPTPCGPNRSLNGSPAGRQIGSLLPPKDAAGHRAAALLASACGAPRGRAPRFRRSAGVGTGAVTSSPQAAVITRRLQRGRRGAPRISASLSSAACVRALLVEGCALLYSEGFPWEVSAFSRSRVP